jgi:hypothetical protein
MGRVKFRLDQAEMKDGSQVSDASAIGAHAYPSNRRSMTAINFCFKPMTGIDNKRSRLLLVGS